MSYKVFDECLKVKCAPTAKTVLLVLAHHHNGETGRCDPSLSTIARETCLSRSAILVAISSLEHAGHLVRIHRSGGSNSYRVSPCLESTRPGATLVRQEHPTRPGDELPPVHVQHPTRPAATPKQERTGSRKGKEQEGASLVLFNDPRKPDPKAKAQGTLEQLRDYAVSIGLPASDGETMHDHWTANGWKNGVNRVQDWQAGIRKWKSSGWLPSQKGTPGATKTSKPSLPPL